MASSEFSSREEGGGTGAWRTGCVPKFVVTKSSASESHLQLGLSAKTNMAKVFFAAACHSSSNQYFNMRDRLIRTNNK